MIKLLPVLAAAATIAAATLAPTVSAEAGARRFFQQDYYYPRTFRYPYYPFGGYGLGDGSPASYRNRNYDLYYGDSHRGPAADGWCIRRTWNGRNWIEVYCPC